jgi:NADH:ubiquinone oxidoreductase subunit C
MKLDAVFSAVRRAFPDQECVPQAGLMDETYLALPPQCVHPTVRLLGEQFDIRHLSTITAQQLGEEIELLYHFWAGAGLTLRTRLPVRDPCIPTITDLVAGAAFYEREAAEMLGVVFDGHPDPRLLFLPEGWTGHPPLRSDASGTTPVCAAADEPETVCELPAQPAVETLAGGRMVIPIGPQHPLLKEPLSYMLTVEGERIVDSALRLGYVHRGIERL